MRPVESRSKGARLSDGAGDPRLRWYPRSWRARYGEELVALLDDEYDGRLPILVQLGLVTGGIRQWIRQSGLAGDSRSAADGVRAGALLVLAAWGAFVIAGAGLAKFSEHFDEALPHSVSTHHLADIAFTVLQTVAAVASILVVVGALFAFPALLRYLRAGGWPSLRGHVLRALACSGLTVAVTVPLLEWAHHLTTHQRNGGLHWYGVLFLIWVALVATTLALWTVVAIATGGSITFSKAILATEAILAASVAVLMIVMVGATAVWWAAMATYAPSYFNASPGGAPGTLWDMWLVATVSLMVVAMCAGVVGVHREARLCRKMLVR
jgi:hypothetical protein